MFPYSVKILIQALMPEGNQRTSATQISGKPSLVVDGRQIGKPLKNFSESIHIVVARLVGDFIHCLAAHFQLLLLNPTFTD